MNAIISSGVLLTLLFVGLAQTGSIPPPIGYGIAGVTAVVTFGLAIARYKGRKDAGE